LCCPALAAVKDIIKALLPLSSLLFYSTFFSFFRLTLE